MSSAEAAWAMRQVTGSPVDKLVLILIGDEVSPHGPSNVSVDRLARIAEITVADVEAAIGRLRDLRLLRTTPQDGRRIHIEFLMD